MFTQYPKIFAGVEARMLQNEVTKKMRPKEVKAVVSQTVLETLGALDDEGELKRQNLRSKGFGLIKAGRIYMAEAVTVGSKIKFREESQAYTVQASNRFFSVCTKPLNIHKTVLYTIVDWHHQFRGTENLVFGMGAESREDCEEMLERLTMGESEVSYRNRCELNIAGIIHE